ncbi:hypothetical protein NDU88_001727 [Pleurodeles waltl]|uniref:Uncharacterized protein n=1 Tax=Pleurodeles waltl TaxID=8319 RepID=A0AAV7UW65_PLEWA|nr:hypothetical protein NDU88_001727 [Pleurodeles waltl]
MGLHLNGPDSLIRWSTRHLRGLCGLIHRGSGGLVAACTTEEQTDGDGVPLTRLPTCDLRAEDSEVASNVVECEVP